MVRIACTSIMSIALVVQGAAAQEWARKMFKVRSHDFGTVARNSESEFAFELENLYAVEVRIASVRTSCGCTTPHITKNVLKTYEKGAIRAVYNTDRFVGQRSATLTVTFDQPNYAEVQLTVSGYIRSDVMIQPGGIEFSSVDQGQSAERTARIDYYGNRNWTIREVRVSNEYLQAEVRPVQEGSGRTSFDLVVRLNAAAPVGYFTDQVTLVTNDPDSPTVPVAIHGSVAAPITVSPASLFLGVLRPGQDVKSTLVVRAKQPFRITSVETKNQRFTFQVPDKVANLQLIPITFTSGERTTKVDELITVHTDLPGEAGASCRVTAAVVEEVATN